MLRLCQADILVCVPQEGVSSWYNMIASLRWARSCRRACCFAFCAAIYDPRTGHWVQRQWRKKLAVYLKCLPSCISMLQQSLYWQEATGPQGFTSETHTRLCFSSIKWCYQYIFLLILLYFIQYLFILRNLIAPKIRIFIIHPGIVANSRLAFFCGKQNYDFEEILYTHHTWEKKKELFFLSVFTTLFTVYFASLFFSELWIS